MNEEKIEHYENVVVAGDQVGKDKATQRLNSTPTNTGRAYTVEVPGRNDLCHCGYGKKYKHCHGAAVQQAIITQESIKYIRKKSKYLTKRQAKEAEAIIEATDHKCKNCKYIENGACCNGTVKEKPATIDEINNCTEFGLPEILNATTVAAIQGVENGEGKESKNPDELFAELNKKDDEVDKTEKK